MVNILNKISICILPFIVLLILSAGMIKKVPVYEEFVEGAKDGFGVAIKIIPYLVAIIVGVSMFKASGAINLLTNLFGGMLEKLSISPDIITLMITRPLSGSAALGVFSDIAKTLGPDDFTTKLAAIMVGSSETTFYVLAVYFGSVGIKKLRYALLTGVMADIINIVLAILVARVFFLASM